MAIDFPDSPTDGQVYTVGNSVWIYDLSNNVWNSQGFSGPTGPTGPTGPIGATGPIGVSTINTDSHPGSAIYVGGVDPTSLYSVQVGDIWIQT